MGKGQPRIKGYKTTIVDGIKFKSRREASYYIVLREEKKRGKIKDFRCQVKYELIPSQYPKCLECNGSGKDYTGFTTRTCLRCKGSGREPGSKVLERAMSYYADFVVDNHDGSVEVIDTKGYRTEVYKIKKKLMLWIHGIRIIEK